MKLFKKLALTVGALATILVAGQIKSEAASLTFNNDLQGYDATITTKNGQNILTTRKGTWELDENTQIFSSKNLTINLNNTQPVNIDAIYTPKNLQFKGSGQLNASTDGQFGINVGGYLYAFICSKDAGKITSKGTTAGVNVYNGVKIKKGTLEGYGDSYGIWSNKGVEACSAGTNIKAVASADNGVGIWAVNDISSLCGSNVYDEGGVSGAYSKTGYIKATSKGTLKGASRDINSSLSALHADRLKLYACSYGSLIEEYKVNANLSDLGFDTTQPFNIQQFKSIDRNMNSFKNYAWSITNGPGTVKVQNTGLLLENLSNSTLSGTRTEKSSCYDKIKLSCHSTHTVILSNLSTGNGGANR